MPGNKPKPRHPVAQPLDKPYRYIALTQGQTAIVDADDFDWLSQWNWFAYHDPSTNGFYAQRYENRDDRVVKMHNEVLKCGPREQADHKNHNTLDNRKQNLRKANGCKNSYNRKRRSDNSSGFKGVHLDKRNGRWYASISYEKKSIYLGGHPTPEQAARAYDEAAKQYHGEFAYLNFPSG